MSVTESDEIPCGTGSDNRPANEPCEITIEMSADQLAMMIGQLASSAPKSVNEPVRPARDAFGSIVKNFSPKAQSYLLGETAGAYWLTPEVSASTAFFHRQNQKESEKPLPGEVTCDRTEGPKPSASSKKKLRVVSPHRPREVERGNVTFGRAPDGAPIAAQPLQPLSPEAVPSGLSELEQKLEDEGYRYADQNLNRLLVRAASKNLDIPVVLVGPVGVGKSRLARTLHDCYWEGSKGNHPFVEVNCAQLANNLADAELFGYAKGAFSGAAQEYNGYFGQADDGTLFLDEFEELPLSIQAKLLSSFDPSDPLRHRFKSLGYERLKESTFRLIVATNVEPKILLTEKRLRPDFHSRLGPCFIRLPSLMEEPDRIAQLFWKIFSEVRIRRKSEATISLDPTAECKLNDWFASGKGKWINNRRDLVHAANELLVLCLENNGRFTVNCVDSLLDTMEHYWESAVETELLTIERDNQQLKIRVDYSSLLELCFGQELIQGVDPTLYPECIRLIWANLIGGSARQAGMIFYQNKYHNPTDKMTKQLRECGLLPDGVEYKTMLNSMQCNFLNALTNKEHKRLFTDIFNSRPLADDEE